MRFVLLPHQQLITSFVAVGANKQQLLLCAENGVGVIECAIYEHDAAFFNRRTVSHSRASALLRATACITGMFRLICIGRNRALCTWPPSILLILVVSRRGMRTHHIPCTKVQVAFSNLRVVLSQLSTVRTTVSLRYVSAYHCVLSHDRFAPLCTSIQS